MAFSGAIPAGLAAMIVVLLARTQHQNWRRAAAVIAAAVVTRVTNRTSVVIGAGMATFAVLATQV